MARKLPIELKCDRYSQRAYVRYGGKKTYFGKWGSQESFRAFAAWLRAQTPGIPRTLPAQEEITLAACVALYLGYAESYYSRDGKTSQEFVNVRTAAQVLLRSIDDSFKAIDFGPRRLKDLQRDLAAEMTVPRQSRPAKGSIGEPTADSPPPRPAKPPTLKYARTTINSIVDRIRRLFRWCVSEELIPASVLTALETVSGLPKGRRLAREPQPVTAVSFYVVADTLPHVSPTVAAMVQVQALCGMRPQDVCGMTTGALDMRGDVWLYRPAQHKGTHRDQTLVKAIPLPAQEILRPLLRSNLSEPLFAPLDSRQFWGNAPRRMQRGFFTTAAYGKAIASGIQRAQKKAVEGEGDSVPHWAPNQLRHAIATELRRTASLEAAQVYLGHAKPDTTLIYAEQTVAALVEVARGFVSPLVQPRPLKLG